VSASFKIMLSSVNVIDSMLDTGVNTLDERFTGDVVDLTSPGADGRAEPDIVGMAIVVRGYLRSRAECSCGWRGYFRFVSAVAIHDAHVHVAQKRCCPAVPLVSWI
jgi:hypothetical protein